MFIPIYEKMAPLTMLARVVETGPRKDLGTGILHNKTNGGEGSSGHKTGGWKWSEESKSNRRGSGNPAFGKKQSAEVQQKKREKMIGHKWSDETQSALKGRKQDPAVVAKRAESCRKAWALKKQLNS